ncbi:MAG TPA: dephospho-CoA kinase [Candidatus Limnocylindrales bacterium]|nr:dephospho-CoA kinase [Candidatus Limnocylindrales bacterium]
MKVIGLTGGVGMGKSTCADLLRARGLPVIDTDDLARVVVEPQQPALTEIRELFGPSVLTEDGHLRRDELARRVFADPAARKQLEHILHPRIRQLWRAQVETWRTESHSLALVVIPLLFETGAQSELDATICVACTASTQQQRLLDRGWDRQQIQRRIDAQWQVQNKIAAADFLIWSEGSLELHAAQLDRILHTLDERVRGALLKHPVTPL